MNRLFLLICVICVICGGCESISKSRRISYIDKHPELSLEQRDLMLNGRLWVGMTPSEARAVLGNPNIVGKDILGEKEVWSYIYKDQFTTHKKYAFDRILRLEFISGRLCNWRED